MRERPSCPEEGLRPRYRCHICGRRWRLKSAEGGGSMRCQNGLRVQSSKLDKFWRRKTQRWCKERREQRQRTPNSTPISLTHTDSPYIISNNCRRSSCSERTSNSNQVPSRLFRPITSPSTSSSDPRSLYREFPRRTDGLPLGHRLASPVLDNGPNISLVNSKPLALAIISYP
jgi:hypothetical protein